MAKKTQPKLTVDEHVAQTRANHSLYNHYVGVINKIQDHRLGKKDSHAKYRKAAFDSMKKKTGYKGKQPYR